MTKEAIAKLNDKQRKYCEVQSALIDRDRKNMAKALFLKNSGKLRGFLECLTVQGVITGMELKALYLFYFSDNRMPCGNP